MDFPKLDGRNQLKKEGIINIWIIHDSVKKRNLREFQYSSIVHFLQLSLLGPHDSKMLENETGN